MGWLYQATGRQAQPSATVIPPAQAGSSEIMVMKHAAAAGWRGADKENTAPLLFWPSRGARLAIKNGDCP